jgi:hypothetical protein
LGVLVDHQAIPTLPHGTDSAPNLVVFVHSSLKVIASAITAPDVKATSGPSIDMHPMARA